MVKMLTIKPSNYFNLKNLSRNSRNSTEGNSGCGLGTGIWVDLIKNNRNFETSHPDDQYFHIFLFCDIFSLIFSRDFFLLPPELQPLKSMLCLQTFMRASRTMRGPPEDPLNIVVWLNYSFFQYSGRSRR